MKPDQDIKAVIMCLDQAFGSLRLMVDKDPITLAGIDIMPSTGKALNEFTEKGIRTILLVAEHLPADVFENLEQFLPKFCEIFEISRDFSKTLSACSKSLAIPPEHTVFVAADRTQRNAAVSSGFQAVPHIALASVIARGHSLAFVRVEGDREPFERIPDLLPYFVERTESGEWIVFAAMSRAAIVEAVIHQLQVEFYPLDLATEDPLFIRLDKLDSQIAEVLRNQKVLSVEGRRMLVALGPTQSTDALAINGQHGYLQFLMPSPELLIPAPNASNVSRRARLAFSLWPREIFKTAKLPVEIDPDIFLRICPVTAESFQADVDRYTGGAALDSAGPIVSRHIEHPDNSRAVQALMDDLNGIGYCAYTQSFNYEGQTLENVIADLPGTGYFIIRPDILAEVREILIKYPLPDPPEPWLKPVIQLLGEQWFQEQRLEGRPALQIRNTLEMTLELNRWYPWWLETCEFSGWGAQLVLVGAHMDSTVDYAPNYTPSTDPAPGADDNASGIAATLAIAKYLSGYRGRLIHTVRFCFFNAEEHGLVGSKAYAAMLKAAGAPVKAVICTDMIGYNSDAAFIFEIHAGYSDPAIRDLSVPIANTIASWAACLGNLAPAQIYQGTSDTPGADRNLYDGAINRSDHGAFHQQGYPAVVVSEDFFANLPTEPGADPNPNFHKPADTMIDSQYSADITCAVAFAVRELASG